MGYILVNPRLPKSNFKSSKKNSTEAAEQIWSQLSSNIKSHTPKFYFTIQEAGSSKLSHFIIKESLDNDRVKYNLKEFKGKKIDEKTFLNELNQEGGKKHKYKDDSSSSSSSSSSEVVFTFPAGKTHKDLQLLTYYPTIYGVPNMFLPTFSSTYTPYLNIMTTPNFLLTNTFVL
jgi:hypothetical protein